MMHDEVVERTPDGGGPFASAVWCTCTVEPSLLLIDDDCNAAVLFAVVVALSIAVSGVIEDVHRQVADVYGR